MRKILIFLLCFCTVFVCFVIPSFADEGVTPRATPSDLTGVTVTVPAGWTATAGFGSYSLSGNISYSSVTDASFSYFRIGYTSNLTMSYQSIENMIAFGDVSLAFGAVSNSVSFTLTNLSGADVDNPTLIQWFVDSGATFEGGSAPETSSITGGIYHFKQFGDLPDIPDAGWSDGEGYTYSYTVAGKMVTTSRNYNFTTFNVTFDEYVSNSYYTVTFSVDTDIGTLNLATYTVSYGQVTLVQREGFKYIVFDEALIGTYDDIEFIRDFLVSGLPSGDTSPTDNPWLYILDMIIEALKVDLFGYFSVWDIFTTICGIFIVTWLLKLLAGG